MKMGAGGIDERRDNPPSDFLRLDDPLAGNGTDDRCRSPDYLRERSNPDCGMAGDPPLPAFFPGPQRKEIQRPGILGPSPAPSMPSPPRSMQETSSHSSEGMIRRHNQGPFLRDS